MTIVDQPQWFISGEACALCDGERHLAHIVRAGTRWFAFDATRPNGQGFRCLFLGSFIRRLTAMAAVESETLPAEISTTEAADPKRVHQLIMGMLKNSLVSRTTSRRRRDHSHRSNAA
jgi:hypothetical protein